MHYTCCVCDEDIDEAGSHLYREKRICEVCWQELRDEVNKKTDEKICTRCGVDEFNDLEQCSVCKKWFCLGCIGGHRMQAMHFTIKWETFEEKQREKRPACAGCGFNFYTSRPHWYLGQAYCDACYQNLCKRQEQAKQQTDESFKDFMGESFADFIKRMYQQQEAPFHFDYIFSDNPYQRRTEYGNASSTANSTKYYSSAVLEAFTLLGLAPGASVDEIKKAYKAKALVIHPDLGGNHDEMVKLNKAKEVALKHAERK